MGAQGAYLPKTAVSGPGSGWLKADGAEVDKNGAAKDLPQEFAPQVRKTPSWPRSWANSSLF
jgi:hypothetical protein